MARSKPKAAAESVEKAATAADNDLLVRPALEPSDDTFTVYVNYLEVARSRHEFALYAARVPAKLSAAVRAEAERSGTLAVEPQVQLLIAPTLMPGLIKALQAQLTSWEAAHGPVRGDTA